MFCELVASHIESSTYIWPMISAVCCGDACECMYGSMPGFFDAPILYPEPSMSRLIHDIHMFMKAIHLIGPPTLPWRTPLPCLNLGVARPCAVYTAVVAPAAVGSNVSHSPMPVPASRFTRSFIMCYFKENGLVLDDLGSDNEF